MRLFVGIEIDPAVATAAGVLANELRRRAGRVAPAARITWVAPERLHLTVRFLGNSDDERAHAIGAALAPAAAIPAFELTLAGAGAFPPTGAPRVIWAGLGAGREHLLEVERDVTGRLAAIGIPPEPRPFNPHLTLARVREPAGLRAPALLDGLADTVLGTTVVRAITLFESRLSPTGPTYVAVQRTALAPSRA